MQQATERQVPASILTPDRVETRLGILEFTNGALTAATAQRLYENGDFTRSVEAFLNGFRDASIDIMRTGMLSIGGPGQRVLIFPEIDRLGVAVVNASRITPPKE